MYVELQAFSNFSFLEGASHPYELIETASKLGYQGLALTDINSLAGVVRAYSAAKEKSLHFHVGCALEITAPNPRQADERYRVLVYPTNRDSYGALCRLLTTGKRRVAKGGCLLGLDDFLPIQNELVSILVSPAHYNDLGFLEFSKRLADNSKDKNLLSLSINHDFSNGSEQRLRADLQLAEYFGIRTVVTGNVRFHLAERKILQDVLTCVKHKTTIDKAGYLLQQNAEAFLKPLREIKRIYRDHHKAIKRTLEISEQIKGFSLKQLKYEYPHETYPSDQTPSEYLSHLVFTGARKRYPLGISDKVMEMLHAELKLIQELNYEKYFLTCYDIVKFARQRNILCQGRGAAANSAVCFCLEITSVDPTKIDLLFARFVSKERDEPPDIDIDFEHERREEVIQYIYQKYGRERAGLTCEVVTYRQRSAIRDIGKALGFSLAEVDQLAKSLHRWTGCALSDDDIRKMGFDPQDSKLKLTLSLTAEVYSFPRHLSQHVGGFVISEKALSETVPILNASMPERTIIEWDKDDIEELGMLKIDVLALGMLSCIKRALELINKRRLAEHKSEIQLHTIPAEDPTVYEMLCRADTVGVFQIESRAQMSMLPRLKPRCFYDLVIEVAIVRPGPIQGNMVHPYLRRRQGIETITYPDQRVADILGKTMGVPIFQEQAMRLAIVLASFTPGEAEALRRAMSAWKRDRGIIAKFRARIIEGMLKNSYSLEFAESCMNQIKGFSEYGFPESHAASFALLVYASAWIKKHYPTEFATALINSQPMGFYAPAQIVSDAKEHGVEIRPIDINESFWDCHLQRKHHDAYAIRLGLRLVKGISAAQANLILQARDSFGKFTSIKSIWEKARNNNSRLRKATLIGLAKADAFLCLGLDSREAIWQIKALPEEVLPLDSFLGAPDTPVTLPVMNQQELMFQDYKSTGLSLRGHPIGFIRANLDLLLVSTAVALKRRAKLSQNLVSVAGIVIVKQRPQTAKGVVFVTLEDETGIVNLIIRPHVFEQYRHEILGSTSLLAYGALERIGEVVYVSVNKLESLDRLIIKPCDEAVPFPNKNYSY